MVLILFGWCLWFTFNLARSSPPEAAEGVLAFEKHPRHDKSWWLWNLEAKEKPLIPGTLDKDEKDNHKLRYKKLSLQIGPVLKAPISKEDHDVRKRWLPSGFGFGTKKNLHKESRKWRIEGESSGAKSSSGTRVIQDPWIMKMKGVDHNCSEIKHHRKSSRGHKKSVRPQIVLQQRNFERSPVNSENILFRRSNLTGRMRSLPLNPTRKPGPSLKTYGDLKPLPSMTPQVRNKPYGSVWDRYVTQFSELKFNPSQRPYPFHDPRSSIPWYTPWNGQPTPTKPTGKNVPGHNHRMEDGFDEIMSKDVAKSKGKSDPIKQERTKEEFELIPKVYALSRLQNSKQQKKIANKDGWLPESVTNPIIVPGFKRKYVVIAPPEDETRRPYIVRAREPAGDFDEEYIQVPRANRDRTKLPETTNDHKLTVNGPWQLPSPYGFPGGVNISILVPNPPAPSHEVPLVATSMSTEKHSKKKKERKKKIKDDDSLLDVLSATRSQSVGDVAGYSGQKLSGGLQLIKYRPQDNTMANEKYSVFDVKTNNFSLMNHVRNLTLDQVNWDKLMLGMQPENLNKPELSDPDEDEDEIRMLYDEQTSSTTFQRSTERLVTERTVSFEWYRFTDYASRIPNVRKGGKLRITSLIEPDAGDDKLMRNIQYRRSENAGKMLTGEENDNPNSNHPSYRQTQKKVSDGESKDQWDALDEDLKNIVSGKNDEVVWQLKNRKREADYEIRDDDIQGYYRLSSGENPLKNPSHLIMSAFRRKSDKHRDRDYDDDIPEDRIRGRTRTDEQFILNAK